MGIQACSKNGPCVDCIISLDPMITTLFIQRASKLNAKPREIPLETIEHIIKGADLPVEVDLALDANCATLLFIDGQAVAFRLKDILERDLFAYFLMSFVNGRRNEVSAFSGSRASAEIT